MTEEEHAAFAKWATFVQSVYFWKAKSFSKIMRMGRVPSDIMDALLNSVARYSKEAGFPVSIEGYEYGRHTEEIVEQVHESYFFFEVDPSAPGFKAALNFVGRFAANALGHPVRVVNVRLWRTPTSVDRDAGPNTWHKDGHAPGILKTMLFLTPASKETGTTEIELESGERVVVEGPVGSFVLFDNNGLLHRGFAPFQKPDRAVMEVTLMPSLWPDFRPIYAGSNAQHPLRPPLFG